MVLSQKGLEAMSFWDTCFKGPKKAFPEGWGMDQKDPLSQGRLGEHLSQALPKHRGRCI